MLNIESVNRDDRNISENDLGNLIDFRRAIDVSIIMSLTDKKGIIQSANKKFCEISQYTEAELIGRSHNIVNSGYHPREFFTGIWKTILAGEIWSGEIKNKAKDGSFYWVDTVIVPIYDKEHRDIKQFLSLRVLITDKKEAEFKLKKSKERSESILNAIPDLIIISNIDGAHTYANKNYCDFFNISVATLVGQRYTHLTENYIEEYVSKVKSLSITQSTFEHTDSLPMAVGSECRILWTETGIFDAQGSLIEILSVGRDVTQLKLSEEAISSSYLELQLIDHVNRFSIEGASYTDLMKALPGIFNKFTGIDQSRFYSYNKVENKLELMVDTIPDGLLQKLEGKINLKIADMIPLLNNEGHFQQAIAQQKTIITSNKEQIIAIISEHTSNKIVKQFAQFAQVLLKVKSFAIIPVVSNNEVVAIITLAWDKPFNAEDTKRINRFVSQISAALSKAKMEEEIARQRKFTETILNNIPADIAVFDENHRYLFLNPLAVKNAELRQWLIGKDDFDYCRERGVDIQVAENRRAKFMRAINENMQVEWIDEHVKADGGKGYVLRKFYPYLEENKLKYVFGYGIDVTNIKNAEEAVREANTMLESKVKERTAELEILNNDLSYFSSMLSHDLRAPIRLVSSFADLLLRSLSAKLTVDDRELIDVIKTNARKMENMIAGLLKISRLGSKPVYLELVNTQELLNGIIEQLKAQWSDININFEIADVPPIYSDGVLVQQIFVNLLSNAVKYSSKRSTVHVVVGFKEADGSYVFTVSDNGAGFDMTNYHKLFKGFTRLHAESEFEGTGLGLSNVKRFVEKLNGRVWAESILDVGSKFYFSIPAVGL